MHIPYMIIYRKGSMKLFYDIAFIMYRRNGEVGVYFNEG